MGSSIPAASLVLVLAVACAEDTAAPGSTAVLDTETLEALCPEHGVVQSLCTKHNPALIPVFQAKGDWCPEHGFPMSFCPVHHPELGGRPPTAKAEKDGAPADGTKIRFKTRATAEQAGLTTVAAAVAPDEGGVEAVAHLTWDATKVALVGAKAPGVVQTVKVDVGAVVREGQTLATIQSPTAASDRSMVEAARARRDFAKQALERKKGLSSVVPQAELARVEQELAVAEAELQSLEQSVGYTLTAPLAGIVTRREVTVGASVEPGATLFEIVDPSRLWAEVDVPETDVSHVKVGQSVALVLDGLDERPISGTLEYVAPSIDADTRTALARISVDNTDGLLRANMSGTARIATGSGKDVLVVPSAAVQRAKSVDVVFLERAVDEYDTKRVTVIRRQGDVAYVKGGIAAGDEVVVEGSFLLKTEILKDSIGAGCCDVE